MVALLEEPLLQLVKSSSVKQSSQISKWEKGGAKFAALQHIPGEKVSSSMYTASVSLNSGNAIDLKEQNVTCSALLKIAYMTIPMHRAM